MITLRLVIVDEQGRDPVVTQVQEAIGQKNINQSHTFSLILLGLLGELEAAFSVALTTLLVDQLIHNMMLVLYWKQGHWFIGRRKDNDCCFCSSKDY